MTKRSFTTREILETGARLSADRPALISEDGVMVSYGQLIERVQERAGQIYALASGGPRPRIGIALPNGPDMAVTLLAATLVGQATPFNPALTKAEFERYFDQTGIDLLIVPPDVSSAAEAVAKSLGIPVLVSGDTGPHEDLKQTVPPLDPLPDDVAMVLMTSGSTGVPKIVPLTHRNVCTSAGDVARSIALGPQDRCLVMWQQFHIGGLVDLLLAPLSAQGSLVLTGGFDAEKFFDLEARFQPTWFQGVPTTLAATAQHAKRQGRRCTGGQLRLIRSVAAALTPSLQADLAALFDVPIVRTLGMTEASPLITSTALPPAKDKPGSVGKPCGPELGVFHPDMTKTAIGVPGEIAIRGPNVFSGYENNPEANAALFRDGWFFTGDNGYLDADGDLFLTGRTKEQINRGGYKIMPSEVEEALSAHPAILEAAVFGLVHPTLGEDVAAAVSLKADGLADPAALRAHLADQLAANKVPGRILILQELPRNPVGKIDRLALAQLCAATGTDLSPDDLPATPMEQFLAEIWCAELALEKVGKHEEFTVAGGDSLSALRIIVAMEETLGQALPEEIVGGFSTIAGTAAALDEAGIALPEGTKASIAAETLQAMGIGTEGVETGQVFGDLLRRAKTTRDIDAAFERLTVYEVPSTIVDDLEGVDEGDIGAAASATTRFLLKRRVRQKAKALGAEIKGAGASGSGWTQTEVSETATLYSDPNVPVWQKTLIFGFCGKMMRLQLPTFRFLLNLDARRFDLLLLRDPSHRLFAGGLPDMGSDLPELAGWLDDFATTQGYGQSMSLGTSGGGLAALYAGLSQGWERAVASSAPSPAKHPDLGKLLKDIAPVGVGDTRMIVTHAVNDRDVAPADELMNLFPEANRDVQRRYTSHNVLDSADRAGLLSALLSHWFED